MLFPEQNVRLKNVCFDTKNQNVLCSLVHNEHFFVTRFIEKFTFSEIKRVDIFAKSGDIPKNN